MKIKLLVVFTTLFFTALQGQNFNSPIEYLKYVNKEQEMVTKSMWKYTKTVAHSKSGKRIETTRKSLIKSIQQAQANIIKLKNGYNGDTDYNEKIINYLAISENIISEDYAKIVDMQEIAEQSYDQMEAYLMMKEKVNERMSTEQENLNLAFKTFAAKYNINLSEEQSELGKKMKISDEVFKYYDQFYLIFFKCNITESNLLKAITANDKAAIQQYTSALESFSNEGLEKIALLQPFKKDKSLLDTTIKSMQFYKKVATEFGPASLDFMIASEKFENVKNTLEKKSQKDRTNEEIDYYNLQVKEINSKVNTFNNLGNKFNQERSKTVDSWNTIGSDFISRHVPVD
jgi:hypothetical protein